MSTLRFHQQFLPFHKKYYENLENYMPDNSDLLSISRSIIPVENWQLKRSSLWFYAQPNEISLPLQGWKIHVSATISNHKEILEKSIRYFVENNIAFKFLVDKKALMFSNDKLQSRGSSGKFITVYPVDENHFKNILEDMYVILKDFEGPYILSDRRYKNAKVLYYRYGEIKPIIKLNYKGERDHFLISPENHFVEDPREPFWNPPNWVKDPFEELDPISEQNVTLNGRYEIEKALSFSVSGGVYLAKDLKSNNMVVLKEARPYTGDDNDSDAVKRLTKEFNILKEIEDLQIAPRALDKFYEWEHLFIAIEYIEGQELVSFITSNNPIIRKGAIEIRTKEYMANILHIWKQLALIIKSLHDKKIIYGDLSTQNIMILNSDNVEIKLIDFEAGWRIGKDIPSNLITPGYAPNTGIPEKDEQRDVFAFGAIMLATLFPINNILALNPSTKERVIPNICRDFGIEQTVMPIILQCLNEDPAQRPNMNLLLELIDKIHPNTFIKNQLSITNNSIPKSDILKKISLINQSMINEANILRQDCLFPSDPIVFYSNPLSMAHGACGILYSIIKTNGEIPSFFKSWVLQQNIDYNSYTPGLYLGMAGIAWFLLEAKETKVAGHILKSALKHPLLYESPTIYYGVAGTGLTCLKFYLETKDSYWLSEAQKIGDYLVANKITIENKCCWKDADGNTWIGYARGASGISLFLLNLHILTKNEVYFDVAKQALNFDLSQLHETEEGSYSVPRGILEEDEKVLSHYWIDGSAGVLTSLIRMWYFSRDESLLNVAQQLIVDISKKYTAFPNLFLGLAGLGNALLDAYQFTGNKEYLKMAYNVVEGISFFEIQCEKGLMFPGEQLFRISFDYASGSAGINLFLDRLIHQKSNFNFTIDEILIKYTKEQSLERTLKV